MLRHTRAAERGVKTELERVLVVLDRGGRGAARLIVGFTQHNSCLACCCLRRPPPPTPPAPLSEFPRLAPAVSF